MDHKFPAFIWPLVFLQHVVAFNRKDKKGGRIRDGLHADANDPDSLEWKN